MKNSILLSILICTYSCNSSNPCNPNYGKVDDEFPDRAIHKMGYTRAIVSLDKAMDSITDEIFFDPEHGGTIIWYGYPDLKLDSAGNKTIYTYDNAGKLISEVDIVAQVNIHSKGSFTISENGENTDFDPATTKTVFWKDTTRILKFNKDSNVALYFKPSGEMYLKQIYLQNECGYEYEIQGYDSLDSLEYRTKTELNKNGWPKRTIMFDAQGKKIGVQSSTYHNVNGVVKTEKLILADTVFHETANKLDDNGFLIETKTKYSEGNYTILTQFENNSLGLKEKQIVIQIQNNQEIARDTFYYFYFEE